MKNMNVSFNEWNEQKKKIENRSVFQDRFPKEKEVWMTALGQNIGFEQNGAGDNFSRPVLIIKKFNNKMFWVAPLSTKQKNIDFYHNFTDPENRHVSVILAQLKLMSVKRLERNMYDISEEEFLIIKDKIKSFL